MSDTLRLDALIEQLQQWKKILSYNAAEDLNPEIRFVKEHTPTTTIILKLDQQKRNRDARRMATIDFVLKD